MIGLAIRGFIVRSCRHGADDWGSAQEDFFSGLVAVVARGIATDKTKPKLARS